MKTTLRVLGIGLGMLVASSALGERERAPLAPGDYARPLSHKRLARSYVLHLPPAAAQEARLPLVIAFHGGGGNAEGFQAYAGLDSVADREGFAVVYPNGTGRLAKRFLTFNAGGCCGWAMDNKVDDVGFALKVIDSVARLARIDRSRIYATGHSNGAMMAYRLAAEAADQIAAIAPVSGGMNLRREFAPSRAVPVLHIHSTTDPRALYAGGDNKSIGGLTVHHQPVIAGLQQWETRNGCGGPGTELERRTAPAPSGQGEHTAVHIAAACPARSPVELWKLSGPGHGWPGESAGPLPERVMGPHTNVIHAAEEIWSFFARFPLNGTNARGAATRAQSSSRTQCSSTATSFDTPFSSIVTPYSRSAIWIVRLLCVISRN